MIDKSTCNDSFELRNETEVQYLPIWVQIVRIEWWFFSLGKTTACLCESGNCPDRSDALYIKLRTGASITATRLTSQVGTGSTWQCLAGVRDSRRDDLSRNGWMDDDCWRSCTSSRCAKNQPTIFDNLVLDGIPWWLGVYEWNWQAGAQQINS